MIPRLILLALAALATTPSFADPRGETAQGLLGMFNSAQELPPFTPEQLQARQAAFGGDAEAVAADATLNDWKGCVGDALVRWSMLKPGVGTLVDGAYGRCADLERQYRDHLMRIAPNGRTIVDVQMARGLTRLLEDIWRPRLIAAALDAELAQLLQPASVMSPAVSPSATPEPVRRHPATR